MSRWLMLAVMLISLVGGLAWSLVSIGEYRAEQSQYEQVIIHMNNTIREERARYEQTDRMLAETARHRADAVRRAGQLADDLRGLSGTDACLTTRIAPDAAERMRQHRNSPPLSEGAGTANVD